MTARRVALAVGAPAALLLLLGLLWSWTASANPSVLPPLGALPAEFAARPDFYLRNLGHTLVSALSGFGFGVGAALLLAIAVVHLPVLRSAVLPVALLLNVTPVVAIAPALVVAFGFTQVPNIVVAALTAFFPMLINALAGFQNVDRGSLEVFRSMAASRADVFLRLRLPSSLRYLFAGARLSASAAMIGAIVSEFTGSTRGLGATIVTATTYLNLPQMWVAILVSALVSLTLLGLIGLIERVVVRW